MFRRDFVLGAFFLLNGMGAFTFADRLVYGEWADKPGDKLTQGINLLIIATSIALFTRGLRNTRTIGAGGAYVLAFVGLLLFSAAWSIDPATTIRRAFLYLVSVIGMIGIANTFDGDEFMELLNLSCLLTAIGSVALLIISPHNALMEDGSLRGLAAHKNGLGQVMMIGVLASLHRIRCQSKKRFRLIMTLSLFTVTAFATKSGTSLVVIFMLYCGSFFITLLCKEGAPRATGAFLIILTLPIAVVAMINIDYVLEVIGKDPTFTGRTELWSYVITDIYQKPILGWGYYAFWSTYNPEVGKIFDALKYDVPQAHNGLLGMLLDIGIIGTIYFAYIMLRSFMLIFKKMGSRDREIKFSLLLCLFALIFESFSEEFLTEPFNIITMTFLITGFLCDRAVRMERRRRYSRSSRPVPIRVASARQMTPPNVSGF